MPAPRLKVWNTISFMKKPVRGGMPAIFIMRIGWKVEIKIGAVTKAYRIKYLQPTSMGADKIHLLCIKPEKNNNTSICFDPTLHVTATMIFIMTTNDIFGIINNKRTGANFCQVRKTNELKGVRLVTKGTPQKWNGARPVLRSNPIIVPLFKRALRSDRIPPSKIVNVPTLWTMK